MPLALILRAHTTVPVNLNTSSASDYRCVTVYPGWLDDTHPTVEDGEASKKVCFSDRIDNKCKEIKNISVKNCGSYFTTLLGHLNVRCATVVQTECQAEEIIAKKKKTR